MDPKQNKGNSNLHSKFGTVPIQYFNPWGNKYTLSTLWLSFLLKGTSLLKTSFVQCLQQVKR